MEKTSSNVIFDYSKEENTLNDVEYYKEKIRKLKKEVDIYKRNPLMLCDVKQVNNEKKKAVISIPNGNQFYVDVSLECKKLEEGDTVLVEQKNLTIVEKSDLKTHINIERFIMSERPKIKWDEIGGNENEKVKIREVVELPLKKTELFKKIGIIPYKGVLLYGEPGTGKTMLAKAVAASTNATFIKIIASELVQKFIGEGAKLVKEIFDYAKKNSPAIIFIDEIDALCSIRTETGTGGEREVQRTMLQLLAEIDGFDELERVKIIACTNRKEILDPAIIRPGRLERHIEMKIPDEKGRTEIVKIHTKNLKVKNMKIKNVVKQTEGFTGADIKELCTAAGYNAIKQKREFVLKEDFDNVIEQRKRKENKWDYKKIFG